MNDALHLDALTAHAALKAGALRGTALLDRLRAVPYADRDAWLDVALALPEAPPDLALPRGAVPYLPAGVDEIVAAVLEAPLRPGDVFVDLGAGIGRVVILAQLLSGATAQGIELQLPLVQCAQQCSAALGLAQVSFVHGDATSVALEGDVFFLYSPFNGETLRRVLRRLEAVAQERPLVLCAVGFEFPDEPWLSRRESSIPALTLYDALPITKETP